MKLIFAVFYVSLNDGPYMLLQNRSFYIYIYSFSTSVYSLDTNIPISKTNGRYEELYLRFRFWPYCHHRHVTGHRPTNFIRIRR